MKRLEIIELRTSDMDSKNHTASPSPVGLRIASALKEFGLVHYSVWWEEERREKS